MDYSSTCQPLVVLVFDRKAWHKRFLDNGLQAELPIPKLDVGGSNPLARFDTPPQRPRPPRELQALLPPFKIGLNLLRRIPPLYSCAGTIALSLQAA